MSTDPTIADAVTTLDARIDRLLASEPDALVDPFALYRDIRAAGRVYRRGPALLVSHFEDVKTLALDNVRLSNNSSQIGSRAATTRAALSLEHRIVFDEVGAVESKFITRADGELHARLRRIMQRAFTPRRIAEMQATIQRYTDELIEPLLDGEVADLASLAYRLPLMAVCDLLSVPAPDRERIHEWSLALGRNRQGVDLIPLLDAHAAIREFRAYVHDLIEQHRRAPDTTSGLLAALLEADEGERLSEDELVATFIILLFAGHETTTNLISIGMLELLRHPDQWELLSRDPGLLSQAVEELLRYISPVQWIVRVALEDVRFAGTRLEEGQTALLLLASGNRDPAAFDDPDSLHILRPRTRQTLAFGFGPHFCLGVSLARLEGELAIGTLVRRFPRMALATEIFRWGSSAQLRHLTHLPVTLNNR
jgi:cytochrome P450